MEKDASRYIFVFFALVMWALSFPSIKFTLNEVDPLTLAAVRFIIPLPIIFLFYCHEKRVGKKSDTVKRTEETLKGSGGLLPRIKKNLTENKDVTLLLMAFALFNVIFPNVFQNYGMQSTSSGVTSIIQGSGPIFTLLLAVVFLKEHLTRFQLVGISIALIGSVLLVSGGELGFDGSTKGKILILLSAISYAISGIIGKIILRRLNTVELTLKSFLMGGVVLSICAILLENPSDLLELSIDYWMHILYLSLFPTCFAFIFWFRALKHLPLSKLVISIFLVPVMAVIFSFLLLDEDISIFTLWTGAMVIIGVAIAQITGKNYRQAGN